MAWLVGWVSLQVAPAWWFRIWFWGDSLRRMKNVFEETGQGQIDVVLSNSIYCSTPSLCNNSILSQLLNFTLS